MRHVLYGILHVNLHAVSTCCASPASSAVAAEFVTSVDIDTYDSEMEKAGDKLVVLDMYTQW